MPVTRTVRRNLGLPIGNWQSRELLRLGTLLLMLLSLRPAAAAGVDLAKEHRREAVLLFNLARFVDWPPDAFGSTNAPLVIGILGRDPFGQALDEVVRGEQANGHPLQVQRCANLSEAAQCQMVFVSASERSQARNIVATLKGHPVLTVSDVESFCHNAGGMVALYVNEQHRLRVRLNLGAAKGAGLSVSSKLIQVAELEPSKSSMNCAPGMLVQGLSSLLCSLSPALRPLASVRRPVPSAPCPLSAGLCSLPVG